jgi:hypothetical protein
MTAESLDLSATIARIDRDMAEQAKLRAESEKFVAEQRKLMATERTQPSRHRWLIPVLIAVVAAWSAASGFAMGLLLIAVRAACR